LFRLKSFSFSSMRNELSNASLPDLVVKITHLINTVALILAIVASTNTSSVAKIYEQSNLKVAILLYVVTMAILTALALGACLMRRKSGTGEALLILAIIFALPFLWVRIIYSALSAFSHSSTFKVFSDQDGAYTCELCMAVLEEMIVAAIYLAAGIKIPALPKEIAYRTDHPLGGGSQANEFGASRQQGNETSYNNRSAPFRLRRIGLSSLLAALVEALSNRKIRRSTEASYANQNPGMAESGRSTYRQH
jgi:hypothetical protein